MSGYFPATQYLWEVVSVTSLHGEQEDNAYSSIAIGQQQRRTPSVTVRLVAVRTDAAAAAAVTTELNLSTNKNSLQAMCIDSKSISSAESVLLPTVVGWRFRLVVTRWPRST